MDVVVDSQQKGDDAVAAVLCRQRVPQLVNSGGGDVLEGVAGDCDATVHNLVLGDDMAHRVAFHPPRIHMQEDYAVAAVDRLHPQREVRRSAGH